MSWLGERQRHAMSSRGINTVCSSTTTTNRQLIFGDFDDDGVKNIDDKRPFNQEQVEPVSDFLLSRDLKDIEAVSRAHSDSLDVIKEDVQSLGYKTKSRIKSLQSVLNKLKRKYLDDIRDFAGLRIFINDEDDARKLGRYIQNTYKIIKFKDFYKTPGLGGYEALHYIVEIEGRPVEVQLKTKEQQKKADEMHAKYKMETLDVGAGGYIYE